MTIHGFRFPVDDFGFRISEFGFRVSGLDGSRDSGSMGFRVLGVWIQGFESVLVMGLGRWQRGLGSSWGEQLRNGGAWLKTAGEMASHILDSVHFRGSLFVSRKEEGREDGWLWRVGAERVQSFEGLQFRGSSVIRNSAPLGICSRTLPRAI